MSALPSHHAIDPHAPPVGAPWENCADTLRSGVTVVTVPADAARGDAREWSNVAAAADGATRVVLDLATLDSLDRGAVGGMVRCLQRLTARGADVRLGGVGPRLAVWLEVVRIARAARVYRSCAEAARSWETPRAAHTEVDTEGEVTP